LYDDVAGTGHYLNPRSYTYDDRLHVMSVDRICAPPT
jgi:hypothetical protein